MDLFYGPCYLHSRVSLSLINLTLHGRKLVRKTALTTPGPANTAWKQSWPAVYKHPVLSLMVQSGQLARQVSKSTTSHHDEGKPLAVSS